MLRVVVLAFAAACGRVDFDANAPDAGPCTEPWGTPVELMVGVSGYKHPSVTADELELYVSMSDDLYVLTRSTRASAWGSPTLLPSPPNSPTIIDTEPAISADGLTLYFASYRMGNSPIFSTTRASRTAEWAAEEQTGVYGQGDVSDDELEIFTSDYLTPIERHARATRAAPFNGRTPLNALINDGSTNASPTISGDGRELYFTSTRGGGEPEIWVARRDTRIADFTVVEPVGFEGYVPEISSDGRHLYFSAYVGGVYPLYLASRCD